MIEDVLNTLGNLLLLVAGFVGLLFVAFIFHELCVKAKGGIFQLDENGDCIKCHGDYQNQIKSIDEGLQYGFPTSANCSACHDRNPPS